MRGADRRWAVALLLLSLGTVGCGAGDELRPVTVGGRAPAYAAPTLAGDTISLESLRGQPVLLNVWATWCQPCLEEMPGLQALHETFEDRGLRILAVSVDRARADREVQRFIEEYGIGFTILRDPSERVARAFRTAGVPESFLIDRDGRITARWIGQFDPMAEDVVEKVRAVVEGQPGGDGPAAALPGLGESRSPASGRAA